MMYVKGGKVGDQELKFQIQAQGPVWAAELGPHEKPPFPTIWGVQLFE